VKAAVEAEEESCASPGAAAWAVEVSRTFCHRARMGAVSAKS
jgi:hypothetical protein